MPVAPNYHLTILGFLTIRPARSYSIKSVNSRNAPNQCLSQDLKTGCLKLAVVKFLGVHIFKGDHNILIFQP